MDPTYCAARGVSRREAGRPDSLTIVHQKDAPEDPDGLANWLPTPAGPFRPILRMYEPDDASFDSRYELPAITPRP